MIILEVKWVDSVILDSGSWIDSDEIAKVLLDDTALHHRTVGFKIAESDEILIIAGSHNYDQKEQSEHRYCGVVVIPKVAILDKNVIATREFESEKGIANG